jgi:hypothetical protein
VFLFAPEDSVYKRVYDTAVDGITGAIYGVATAPSAAELYETEVPSIIMFKKHDDFKVVYEGDLESVDAIRNWVIENSPKWLKTIADINFDKNVEDKKTMLMLWTKEDKSAIKLIDGMIKPTLHSYVDVVGEIDYEIITDGPFSTKVGAIEI